MNPAAVEAETRADANAGRGSPLDPLYAFVKAHLLVANNICLATGTLVATLDFLAPKRWMAPAIVYSATATLLALMVFAAAAPALFNRLASALGWPPTRLGDPLWRRPLWQFCVAILAGVSIVGFASVARADRGGLAAGAIPAVRSLQESLLGLPRDVADIRTGVDSANAKLDVLAERSLDPQRDLASLGYPYDDHGLTKAIKQADARAVGLYVQAGYKAEDRLPMLNLLNGGQEWSAQIAAMLPRSMFAGRQACDEAGLLNGRMKAPADERIAAFKRLCPVDKAIHSLRSRIELDKATPAASDEAAKNYEARKRNLAALLG